MDTSDHGNTDHKTMDPSREYSLTESCLELYQRSFLLGNHCHGTAHAHIVVRDEQIHLFHEQLFRTTLEARMKLRAKSQLEDKSTSLQLSAEYLNQQTTTNLAVESSDPNQLDSSLKLFMPTCKGQLEETPAERFLTPGFSDPPCFAKLTLASINTPFGDAEAMREREQMAKQNVKLVLRRPKKSR